MQEGHCIVLHLHVQEYAVRKIVWTATNWRDEQAGCNAHGCATPYCL